MIVCSYNFALELRLQCPKTGCNWFSAVLYLKKPQLVTPWDFDRLQLMVQSFPVGSSPDLVFFQFVRLDLQTLMVTDTHSRAENCGKRALRSMHGRTVMTWMSYFILFQCTADIYDCWFFVLLPSTSLVQLWNICSNDLIFLLIHLYLIIEWNLSWERFCSTQ